MRADRHHYRGFLQLLLRQTKAKTTARYDAPVARNLSGSHGYSTRHSKLSELSAFSLEQPTGFYR